jgi:hypothetical protein
MSRFSTPEIVNGLYRDLRDRRLLIPIVALAVALVAVPVLLSSSGESSSPPPSTATVVSDDAAAVEPAVLAEQTGIRSYRKRLAALKAKNPFKQKFALPTPGSVELAPEGEAPSSAASASSISSATGPTPDTGAITDAAQSVTDTITEPTSSTPASGGGDDSTSSQQVEEPKPQIRFFAGRVDVKLGQHGETKDYQDVRRLDFLPNEKDPLVVFLGLTEDGTRAIFSLSSEITETSGEGSCAPKKPSPCQFLRLKAGEERQLTVGGDGTTEAVNYRLKLLETHIVRVPDPRDD